MAFQFNEESKKSKFAYLGFHMQFTHTFLGQNKYLTDKHAFMQQGLGSSDCSNNMEKLRETVKQREAG